MKNSKKTVTPSPPLGWIFGALAFIAMGVAVGLKAASGIRQAGWARLRHRPNKQDAEAITRMEGEGGPIIGLPRS